jgi:FMN reductase
MNTKSYSTETLKIAMDIVNQNGAESKILNLNQTPLPIYNTRDSSGIMHVNHAVNMVNWADALILATPDYHGSMSGSLKNFLDYFWSEFAGKTFGYICASHEKGLTVMDQMRTVVRQCYGWSLPYGISINSGQDFNDKRQLINKSLLKRIESFARDLVVYGELIHEQFKKDLKSTINNSYAVHYRT